MARSPAVLNSQARLSDYLTIALMYTSIPREQVLAILKKTGKSGLRIRHLPPFILPYYIVSLSVFKDCSAEEVHRIFFEGTTWAMRSGRHIDVEEIRAEPVSKSAISQARTRLGAIPMKLLFEDIISPSVGKSDFLKLYKGRFLVGLSSGVVSIPGSVENLQEFMAPGSNGRDASLKQMKFVSLVEHGTRIIFAAETASSVVGGTSIAEGVVNSLTGEMLCMAEKTFFNLSLWQQSLKTGATLLWEIEPEDKFFIKRNYADYSSLATLIPGDNNTELVSKELQVRVIKYRDSYKTRNAHYLVTNLLDPKEAPAIDLASLFHNRLKMEEATDILNTHHSFQQISLRSKTPDLVRQEFFGLLLATYILRKTILETDWGKSSDPYDLLSKDLVVMRL